MKFDRENIKIANMLKFFASPEKLAFWRYALLILRRRYIKNNNKNYIVFNGAILTCQYDLMEYPKLLFDITMTCLTHIRRHTYIPK